MKLIPKPKKIEILEGIFECILIEKVNYSAFLDNRILKELKKINVCIKQTESLDAPLLFEKDQSLACEEYKILIKNKQIKVTKIKITSTRRNLNMICFLDDGKLMKKPRSYALDVFLKLMRSSTKKISIAIRAMNEKIAMTKSMFYSPFFAIEV